MKSKPIGLLVSTAIVLILVLMPIVGCSGEEKERVAYDAKSIKLVGAITETVELTFFSKGAKTKCHGTTCKFIEQDGKTSVYIGVPLWLMCGWVDDNIKHGSGAFNDELAQKGYRVVIITADGQMAVFDSRKIRQNNNVILANKVGIKSIKDYPTLVSSDPGQILKLKRVAEIRLEFE